jgi:hypothetical protein
MHEVGKARNVYGNPVCNPEGKRLFGRPKCRRRDSVDRDLQVLRYRRRDRIY